MDTPIELTEDECRDLLRTDTVGRVAFVAGNGPRIVPVNYVLHDGGLEFRTTSYSEVATYAPDSRVAFEVDHLDAEHRRGWSVTVQGHCTRVEDTHLEEGEGPEPWAGGIRPVLLHIDLEEVTGRRVGGPHWPHPVVSGRGRSF